MGKLFDKTIGELNEINEISQYLKKEDFIIMNFNLIL